MVLNNHYKMSRDLKICCLFIMFMLAIVGAIKQNCNKEDDLLKRCPMGLPVLSSPEMSFALTREELDRTCLELRSGIKCIENYTNVCMEKNEQVLFRRIYVGITDAVQQLCTKGEYQDRYLMHADCVKDVRSEYESCSKKYESMLGNSLVDKLSDQSTAGNEVLLRSVCCSFQEYLLCSEQKVLAACGEEAAAFTDEMLKKMSFGISKSFCMAYNSEECGLTGKASYNHYSLVLISVVSGVQLLNRLS